jgi:uncharacterized membrane protein YkvA (DUF1232 family)
MVTAANTETKAPAAMPSAERIQVEAMLSEGGGVSTFTADPPRGAPFSSAPAHEMSTHEAEHGWFGRRMQQAVRQFGYSCLQHLSHRRGRVSESLRQVADAAHRRAEQTQLALGLIDDFKDGSYREVPWSSIAILSAAVLYLSNPRDLIPDYIPVIGDLDNLTLLTLALRLTENDLRAYCRFKGYNDADYFRRRNPEPSA